MSGIEYHSNSDDTCRLVINKNFNETISQVPEKASTAIRLLLSIQTADNGKKILLFGTIESVSNSYESSAKIVFTKDPAICNEGAVFEVYDVIFPTLLKYIDEYSCCISTISAQKKFCGTFLSQTFYCFI